MKIHFLLPAPPPYPIGGSKIIYRYADELSALGHDITISHAMYLAHTISNWHLLKSIAAALRECIRFRNGIPWFDFKNSVKLRIIPRPFGVLMPSSDITFATAFETAHWVNNLQKRLTKRRSYLIQHIEDWNSPRSLVLESWKLPLEKVVIARWLKETANQLGQESTLIQNGLDFSEFGIDVPRPSRNKKSIAMLWHKLPIKGSKIGLEALYKLQLKHPSLQVELFGTDTAPAGIPSWISYHQNPTHPILRSIYNRNSIFLCPSISEGWGLPSCEAMLCGCALVTADNGGCHDFAVHEKSAIIYQDNTTESICNALEILLNDPDLANQIAESGTTSVQRFSWESAVKKMQSFITQGPDTQ